MGRHLGKDGMVWFVAIAASVVMVRHLFNVLRAQRFFQIFIFLLFTRAARLHLIRGPFLQELEPGKEWPVVLFYCGQLLVPLGDGHF